MDKKLLSLGVVILIVGLFLVLAYWPMTAVRGRDLSLTDYEVGDTVKVYGTITRIYTFLGQEIIEIDGELDIVNVDSNTSRKEGDVVYGEVRYTQELLGLLNFWRLQGELGLKRNFDMIFYGIALAGVVVGTAGAVKV